GASRMQQLRAQQREPTDRARLLPGHVATAGRRTCRWTDMGFTRIRVRRTVAVLLAGNVLLLVAIPVLLGVSFTHPTWIVIENLSMLAPTLACFGYALFRGPRRVAAILLGLAML